MRHCTFRTSTKISGNGRAYVLFFLPYGFQLARKLGDVNVMIFYSLWNLCTLTVLPRKRAIKQLFSLDKNSVSPQQLGRQSPANTFTRGNESRAHAHESGSLHRHVPNAQRRLGKAETCLVLQAEKNKSR